MHNLPDAVFESEDAGHAEGEGSKLLSPIQPRLMLFHLDNTYQVWGRVRGDALEAHALAISVVGGGARQRRADLFPSTDGRALRIRQARVIQTGD
jgi:hypothetical protein